MLIFSMEKMTVWVVSLLTIRGRVRSQFIRREGRGA